MTFTSLHTPPRQLGLTHLEMNICPEGFVQSPSGNPHATTGSCHMLPVGEKNFPAELYSHTHLLSKNLHGKDQAGQEGKGRERAGDGRTTGGRGPGCRTSTAHSCEEIDAVRTGNSGACRLGKAGLGAVPHAAEWERAGVF